MPPLQVSTASSTTSSMIESDHSDHSSDGTADALALEQQTQDLKIASSLSNHSHTKAKRSSSMGFISRNFSKAQSRKQDKAVRFADEKDSVVIHPLPSGRLCEETRKILWLTYQDKVTITDDVEEICYHLNCPDEIHPYVQHLDVVWEKCASKQGVNVLTDEDCEKLAHGHKGRGLEKKLSKGLKKNRDTVVKSVLDTQKTYRNLPVGSDHRAKFLRNKYKKLSCQSKVFAQALARGDEFVAKKYNPKPYTVVATSA